MQKKKTVFPFSAARLMLLLTVVCLCAGVLAAPSAEAASEYAYSLTDWMDRVPDTMQISQINIPGTHDTGTTYVDNTYFGGFARCQDWYFPDQLQYGLRWFDIRLGKWKWDEWKPAGYSMRLCHSTFDCFTSSDLKKRLNFIQVLNYIGNFLEKHPSETVIIRLQAERQDDKINPMIGSIMDNHHYSNTNKPAYFPWLVSYKVGDPVPTLGEVRGKCVVLSYKRWNGKKYETGESWTNYEVSGDWYKSKKEIDLYADPPLKRDYIKKLLKKSAEYPQNYYSETNDIFQKTGAFLQSETNNDFPNGPMRISTAITDPPSNNPRECFEYLYYRSNSESPSNLPFDNYASLRDVSLYTQNTRTGWWNFDFPKEHHIRDIITSNYLDISRYTIYVDVTTLPADVNKDEALRLMNPVVKLDNGYQLKPVSEWYPSENPNFYRRDYEKHPAAQTATDVNADFQYGSRTIFAVRTSRYERSDAPGIKHVYEEYAFNNGSKPVEAEITVYWSTRSMQDQRPKNAGDMLALLNEKKVFPFTFTAGKGGSGVYDAPEQNVKNYKYHGEGSYDYSYMTVTLPFVDDGGNRIYYTGLDLKTNEPYKDYVITSVSKDPYFDRYTIYMRYKLDPGTTEVTMPIEWLDGGDYYGMRENAVNYIKNNYTFWSKPQNSLKSATVVDDAAAVVYTLNENVQYKMYDMHEVSIPELSGTLSAPDFHYVTSGRVLEYDANMDPPEKRNLYAFGKAYLMGLYNVEIEWADDESTAKRPTEGLKISIAGNPGIKSNVVYPPEWKGKDFPIQVFDDKNQEIDYEKGINLTIYGEQTTKTIQEYGYIPCVHVEKVQGEYGKLPRYQMKIILRADVNVDVKGGVIWIDGDAKQTSRPMPFNYIVKRYMKDPALGEIPENLVYEYISTHDAGIQWKDSFEEFSFTDLSYFPYWSDYGTACTYSIDVRDVPDYLEEVNGLTLTLTREVEVSGTVDWENGRRPMTDQPEVVLWRCLRGEDTPVPYGEPVVCQDYRYAVKLLPIADKNNVPYDYSITASLPEKVDASTYTVTYNTTRNENTGNVKADGTIKLVSKPTMAEVPVVVTFNNAAAAESETFVVVMEGGIYGSVYREKLELNTENGFKGFFHVDMSSLQTGHPYPFRIRQVPGNTAGWQYDDHEETVYLIIRYLGNMQPVVQLDLGGREEVPFENIYSPVSGTLRLGLEKQITNLLDPYEKTPEETFIFELIGSGFTAEEPAIASRKGEGKAYFPSISFKEAGIYTLQVKETSQPSHKGWEYDEESYPVTVTVEDLGGFLKATADTVPVVTNVLDNVYYDISVQVVWPGMGSNAKAPESVNVQLYADGGNAGDIDVTELTDWAGEFPEMPGYSKLLRSPAPKLLRSAGGSVQPINYTVSADEVPGYKQTIRGSAKTGFVVEYATLPPTTGDSTPLALWLVLLAGCGGVLMAVCVLRRKRG